MKKRLCDITHNCRVKTYADGTRKIMVSSLPIFRERGWEVADEWGRERSEQRPEGGGHTASNEASIERAKRRARNKVFDLAFNNEFSYFVTLTLDKEKIDRYDIIEVTKKLNNWLDNRVRRNGLKYVLVPERHKDGAIHFHGFFNDALPVISSGTYSAGSGKPRRPRSEAQRREWIAAGWHEVYNLPMWSLGFTTAIEIYGQRDAAVGYICKYISKAAEKIGGRWYYSGGALAEPVCEFFDVDFEEIKQKNEVESFVIPALNVECISYFVRGENDG